MTVVTVTVVTVPVVTVTVVIFVTVVIVRVATVAIVFHNLSFRVLSHLDNRPLTGQLFAILAMFLDVLSQVRGTFTPFLNYRRYYKQFVVYRLHWQPCTQRPLIRN